MILTKFTYNNSYRIKICLEADEINLGSQIFALNDVQYSPDHSCWHLPYSKESYHHLKELVMPLGIQIKINHSTYGTGETCHQANNTENIHIEAQKVSTPVISSSNNMENADILSVKIGQLKVEYQHAQFVIKIPYQKVLIDQIRSLQKVWWNAGQKCWLAKASIENHEKIQSLWKPWNQVQFEKIKAYIVINENPRKLFLFKVPEYPKHIMLKLQGYGVDFDFLKHLPDRAYDQEMKRWRIDPDEIMLKRLIDHYSKQGVEIINKIPVNKTSYLSQKPSYKDYQAIFISKTQQRFHPEIVAFMNKMIQERYSWNTIKSYSGAFIKYLEFLAKPITESDTKDANTFLTKIASAKISESEINRYISTLKYFYQHVAFIPEVKIEQIRRPRKSLLLPKILSVQQVNSIMEASDNLKHTTILYTLYSGGMRLNEILNLKLSNILWDRKQIHIEGGKGSARWI